MKHKLKVWAPTGNVSVEADSRDEAIEKCLAKFGLKRWASGYDLVRQERDLAFDKGKKAYG